MKKMMISMSLTAALLLTFSALCSADELGSPWEPPRETFFVKLKETGGKPAGKQSTTSTIKLPFLWGLRFYQKFVSPIDGDKCGMYPTCSGYSARAIRKHGAVLGVMLTVDRMFHEGTEQHRAPLIEKYGVVRYYDPVENNDFWFTDEK